MRERVTGRWALGKMLTLGSAIMLTLGLAAACGGGGGGEGGGGEGEVFPSEQIELIVPWEAGGGTDQTARQLASAAEGPCGTNVIVSNQTGSTGAVGHQAAADAEPDGYTVGIATAEVAMVNHLGVAQITPEDITGVMQYNFDPAAITVGANSPYQTIDDFISAGRSGETIRIGTSGTGGIWHISAAGMAEEVGADYTYVPFDGAAPAIQAVLGGQIEATAASGAEVAPQVEADQLRPLAIMGEDRVDVLPDTPTLQEQDIDYTSGTWRGLAVPNDTPDERVQTLNECFREAYESPEFQEFMDQNGFGLVYKPADEFEQFMNEEYERFGSVIESLNLNQQQ